MVGLPDVESVTKSRAQLAELEAERKVVSELHAAMQEGGWLNEGAVQGDLGTYQPASTIDTSKLEALLAQQGEFYTEAGRWVEKWTGVVIKLRSAVSAALSDPQNGLWKPVEQVILESAPIIDGCAGPNGTEWSDYLFATSFTEFVAARKEYTYQFGMGERIKASMRVLQETTDALASEPSLASRSATLRAAVEACVELNLGDTKEVANAQAALQTLETLNTLLSQGLASLELNDLARAKQACSEENITCSELERTDELLVMLESVKSALDAKNITQLRQAMVKARENGGQRAPISTKA
jgi:hypothetical protein